MLRPLSPDEIRARDDALAAAESLLGRKDFGTAELQETYDHVLSLNWDRETIASDPTIVVLGMALGALFVRDEGLEWARIEDEYGSETVVRLPNFQINCAPISMLQKRLMDGVSVDVADLIQGVSVGMRRHVAEGRVDRSQ